MKTKFTILLFLLLSFQIGKSQYTIAFSESIVCFNISFISYSSPTNATSWHWNFGDGDTSIVKNPVHLYSNSGNYTVQLISSDGINIDSISKVVTIYPYPIANFIYNINGDTVQFIDQTPGAIAQWNWDLGNGTTSNYPNPLTTYSYPPDSCYDVTLTVTSFNGCIDSITKTICITSIEELAAKNITIYPSPIINNQKLIVNGNIKGLGNIIGYDVLGNLISLPFISKNENEIIVETNQLDKGVYFLQLHFDDKAVITKKVVVQ